MAVFKERNGWTSFVRYKDWKGNTCQKRKVGFKTKHEAQEFEAEFLRQATKNMEMTFAQFVELYENDNKHNIRLHTWQRKKAMINKFLIPYFGKLNISKISKLDIINWQTELQDIRDSEGKGYSQTYLRSIQNEFYAIMNHAETYYKLETNPCHSVRKMGKSRSKEMMYWTEDEYFKFREAMIEEPIYYYAFELLYWCGIREGELLALTMEDFNLDKKTLRINKSYQRINRQDVITDPKTERSIRTIALPQFLCDEMEDYFCSLGHSNRKARIFPNTKKKLHYLMDHYSKVAGVPRIRIHDLRHSCVAMLISHNVSSFLIASRLGHENIHITETYAHLFPSLQIAMTDELDRVCAEKSSTPLGGKKDEAI